VFQCPEIGEVMVPEPSKALGWPLAFEYKPTSTVVALFEESRYTLMVVTVPVKMAGC